MPIIDTRGPLYIVLIGFIVIGKYQSYHEAERIAYALESSILNPA